MKKIRPEIIGLAAFAALYLLVISPLDTASERIREELPQKQALLEKHREFIKKYTAEKGRMDEHRKKLSELERRTIKESDPSLAAASIQSSIQDMAQSAGISIDSIRALSPVRKEGYVMLPVHIDGLGQMDNLSRMLNMMDNSQQLLSVDKLEIIATRSSGTLRVKLQVSGVMKGEQGNDDEDK